MRNADKYFKIITVNIEREQHLAEIRSFLTKEKPALACLQEVPAREIEELAAAVNMKAEFKHMGTLEGNSIGLAILWCPKQISPINFQAICYAGKDANSKQEWDSHAPQTYSRFVLTVEFKIDDKTYLIANTHFTWSPHGKPNESQERDLKSLLTHLQPWAQAPNGFIIAGDFNAPRGGKIHNEICKHYIDHLPADIKTTLDQKLHRAAPIIYAVDTFFATPNYSFKNVRVISGVSDHCALVASVVKTS